MYTYLIINIAAILIPFLFSFEGKLKFYRKWKNLFPAIFLSMVIFIPWDILFTRQGIWGFNSRYLSGKEVLGLPVEEWLFFITIPYACVFTYEAVKHYFPRNIPEMYSRSFSAFIILVLLVVAVFHHGRLYTFVTFSALAAFVLIIQFVVRVNYLAHFYLSWVMLLVPFFIINGLLTGSFLDEPVVWYNNAENLGIRLFTIPLEDVFYGMFLLMLNVSIYEKFRRTSPGRVRLSAE